MKNLLKSGFTLIELLIVIAIIGILAGFMLTNLQGSRERARDARRKSDLRSVQESLRLYYNDNQSFPTSSSGAISGAAWGTEFAGAGGATYMSVLPLDPNNSSTGADYQYYRSASDTYVIVAELENPSDPDIADSQARCPSYASASVTKSSTDYVVCEE